MSDQCIDSHARNADHTGHRVVSEKGSSLVAAIVGDSRSRLLIPQVGAFVR